MLRKSKNTYAVIRAAELGYIVDDDGRVWGPRGERKCSADPKGYLKFNVNLYGGDIWPIRIHVLAAYQRFGSRVLQEGIQVRHLDGVRSDNTDSNIAIGSASDNQRDVPPIVKSAVGVRAAHRRAKLSYAEAQQIRRKASKGARHCDLAREFRVSQSVIFEIVRMRAHKMSEAAASRVLANHSKKTSRRSS